MSTATVTRLPKRSEVNIEDTWDLSKLFPDNETWEATFNEFESQIDGYAKFKGTLANGAAELAACLKFDSHMDRLAERLGNYAFLRTAEDQTNSEYQRMMGRFQNIATRAGEAASYIRPEILAIPDETMEQFLAEPVLKLYRLMLERLARYKPYTLGRKRRAIAGHARRNGRGNLQDLSAVARFGSQVRQRQERKRGRNRAVTQHFFAIPDFARSRGPQNGFPSVLRAIRRPRKQPGRNSFGLDPKRHLLRASPRLRQRPALCIVCRQRAANGLRQPDLGRSRQPPCPVTSIMICGNAKWDLMRSIIMIPMCRSSATSKSNMPGTRLSTSFVMRLTPLGSEYCDVMRDGLAGRWCDRYPNSGKQSGAFSYGTYDGDPYIMMNYKPAVLNDVFTLAHEAGHSMHSYFSTQHQPYEYYNYTIFVAEVASTFNEQLLTHHMLENADDDRLKAYLINNEIDGIRGTIIRQTMFAEFEKIMHEMAEAGEPLTVDALKTSYGKLLADYFGPEFAIDDELSLECLRIPHFYRAFYVYKYATGLSAAIALSQRVLNGGEAELKDYMSFLKGGCSKYPLDLLRDAGVDLEKPEPVNTALQRFSDLVDQLDSLL